MGDTTGRSINFPFICACVLLVLAYTADTVSTLVGGIGALANDLNPLIRNLTPKDYLIFSILRLSAASVILVLFWPARIQAGDGIIGKPRWPGTIIQSGYRYAVSYLGTAVVVTLSTLKIAAAISNVALVSWNMLLLPYWATSVIGVVAGLLAANGLLLWHHAIEPRSRQEGGEGRGVVFGPNYFLGRQRRFQLLLLFATLSALCCFLGSRPGNNVVHRSVRIERSGYTPLRVRVYAPEHITARLPGVVVCPALNVAPEMFSYLAMEVARAGMVCAVIDFFGMRTDESRQRLQGDALSVATSDLANAVYWIRSLPEVDRNAVGVVGHSFGASVILETAAIDTVTRASALIGMAGGFGPDRPRNVLLVAGIYDELYPPASLRQAMVAGTGGQQLPPGVVYGHSSDGTSRLWCQVATASHVSEMFHPGVVRQVIDWLLRNLRPQWARPEEDISDLRFFLLWAALASGLAAAGMALAINIRIFRLLGAIGIVFWTVWPLAGFASVLPRAGLVFWALACMVAGQRLAQRPAVPAVSTQFDPIAKAGRWLAWNLLALYCAYCVAAIGGNLANFLREPRWILGIPTFIFLNIFLVVLAIIQQLMAVSTWYCGLPGVQIGAGSICLAEIIRPGIFFFLLRKVIERIAAIAKFSGPASRPDTKNLLVLGILLAALILLAVRRYQEGFFTGDAVSTLIGVCIRLALPTVVAFFLIKRIPAFRRQ